MARTLADFDKMIEEMERELAELKAARIVMARFDGFAPKPMASHALSKLPETGTINLSDLDLPSKKAAKSDTTLYANIKALLDRLGHQEFTVNHVDAVLRQMGKGSDAKHFKNRIAVIIRKLAVEEGLLERTHEGKGNDAHRYRVLRKPTLVKGSKEG
ncbi:MAG: hypothetical protein AB7Q01_04440 [Gammaproteobacteria bacterium]